MSVYQKIQACRASIKASNLKKAGWNEYSKYAYYTPEQVNKLVYEACVSEGLFTKFDLIRDENGLFGQLTVIDSSAEGKTESAVFVAATEMPTITATNASQQMGGCMTFSERYLKQTVFDIVDNTLDPDSQDNRPKEPQNTGAEQPPEQTVEYDKEWLNEGTPEFETVKSAIFTGKRTLKDARKKYKISKKIAALLEPNGI